ncbi:hypothetical protein [Flavobacterium sp.]
MKETSTIKNKIALLSIFGLVMLLLLSPCKVRNFIETQLDLPPTEVANKSLSSFNSSNCTSVEITKTSTTSAQSSAQFVPAFVENKMQFAFITNVDYTPTVRNQYTNRKQSLTFAPLYILHQNFKAYLS